MKLASLRIVMFTAALLLAISAIAQPPPEDVDPGGGGAGGGSCQVCEAYSQNGYMGMRCRSAEPGNWGKRNCRIESYPEGTYCFVDGNDCCVD